MSNQAVSVAEDLMVGAGELYFRRSDDSNGWHHLGNVEEFNITNDVTTVEKNSSMNKRRELMASVSTAISPSASITMNEYNPYNMALGLYGVENVHTQAATTLTNVSYTIPSVPGVLTITDSDGNRYFNLSNVVISPNNATPAKTSWTNVGIMTGATISSGSGTNDVLTDTNGDSFVVGSGSYAGTTSSDIYVVVSAGNNVVGQTDGLTLKVKEGLVAATQVKTCTGTTGTEVLTLSSGMTITVTVNNTSLVPAASSSDAADSNVPNWAKFEYTPAITTLTPGVDYVIDDQRLRGGVITIPATSTLNSGQKVKVSAEVPEGAFPTVAGANAGEIQGELLFLGDPDIGGNYVIEAWKVKITPDGDFTGLIGDDFGSFTLNVKFLADYEAHPQYPFYKATMISRSNGSDATAGYYNPMY